MPPPGLVVDAVGAAWSERLCTDEGGRVPVSLGVDAVEIERLRSVVARTPGFVHRVFTERERAGSTGRGDALEHLAVCFGAKEAVSKALGCGLGPVGFGDVELLRDGAGSPFVEVSGAARDRMVAAGVTRWLVSATHTAGLAVVVVSGLP